MRAPYERRSRIQARKLRAEHEAVIERLNVLVDAKLNISTLTTAFESELCDLDASARRSGLSVTNKWRAERLVAIVLKGVES